jgi:hypothetical protein
MIIYNDCLIGFRASDCKLSHLLLLSLHLIAKRLSKQLDEKQESIIHFTGDHSVFRGK